MNPDKFDKFFICLLIAFAVAITIIAIVGMILLAGVALHYFSTQEISQEIQIVQGTVVEVKEMTDWLHSWTESKVIGYAATLP